METGTPVSLKPHTPQKTNGSKDASPESSNNRNFRVMFEDMRARFNELKNDCHAQKIAHEKTLAERDETIMEMKKLIAKPCVMKMCNEDAFVSKLRKGATGPTKGCEMTGCDMVDVDLIRCSVCNTLVCEECSGVKVAQLRPVMNKCKTLYFSCPSCNTQISDDTTMNAYDILKEKVQTLTEDLQNSERTKDQLIQQQQAGAGAGAIENILNKRLDNIEDSIDRIITKKLEESLKGVTAISDKIENAITANKKTFADAVGGNVTDSLTAAFRNRKNQEIVNQAEREKRSTNLIVYGVNEPTIENQKEEDQAFVFSLLEEIGVTQRPKHILRLGQRADEKKRPMKLVMESENVKDLIMSRLGNLKNAEDAFKKISIREDYSREEREMVQEMVKKAAEKNEAENTQEWKVRGTPKTGLRLVRITKRQ